MSARDDVVDAARILVRLKMRRAPRPAQERAGLALQIAVCALDARSELSLQAQRFLLTPPSTQPSELQHDYR